MTQYAPQGTSTPNPFESLIPVLAEDERKIQHTMGRITTLAGQFAEIMRDRLMPIDRAIVGEDVSERSKKEFIRRGTRLPVWVVLQDVNISGKSLFSGTVYKNHTPTKYDNRSDFEKAVDGFSRHEDFSFNEKAIGISGLGKLVLLSKRGARFLGTDDEGAYPMDYSVAEENLKPSDIFDASTKLSSDELAAVAQDRMAAAIERYTAKLREEQNQLPLNTALERPNDYYEPTSGVLFRTRL